MTTAQIIIIGVLAIIVAKPLITLYFKDDVKITSGILFSLFSFGLLLLITCTVITRLNKFKGGNKCPEYEKVENVYKLKSK